MANPTTNFGWVMPTSTDLVTDLPADFAVFGQSVDTTMAGLKGGTTGQVLSKTSATDMAFTWIDNQVGDITSVTAGTGLTGGGTSGDVTLALSSPVAATNGGTGSATYATGDILYSSATNTLSKLAIGTTGQVLNVSGGVPAWTTISTGGMTLISTTTLSGTSTSISSIPGTYKNLIVVLENGNITGTTNYFRIAPNASVNTTDGMYSSATNTLTGGNNGYLLPTGLIAIQTGTTKNYFAVTIFNYAAATYGKSILSSGRVDPTTAGQNAGFFFGGSNLNVAITSLDISSSAGGTLSGTVKLYGAN